MSDLHKPPIQNTESLSEAIRIQIHHLLTIKSRLPFIKAFDEEIRLRNAHITVPIRNDGVYQAMRDSYDMLVIDLASLREGMVAKAKNGGLLNQLAEHLDLFKEFTWQDVNSNPAVWLGKQPTDAEKAAYERQDQERMAKLWNEVLKRLFPDSPPVTRKCFTALIDRFRKETEGTMEDRNRVRAHRYEQVGSNPSDFFQTISEVESQISVFERYLNDLFLVLTKGMYSMEPPLAASPKTTAKDLVDLVEHGSINHATQVYGAIDEKLSEPPRYYYYCRDQYWVRLANQSKENQASPAPTTDTGKVRREIARPERTTAPPPQPEEVHVKYRTGLAANMSPVHQAAIRQTHVLIEDLKALYVRLWDVEAERIPKVLAKMKRKAAVLDTSDREHRALMDLINAVGIGSYGLESAPRFAKKIGIDEQGFLKVPLWAQLTLRLFRSEYPDLASRLEISSVERAITAFSHRAGRFKRTEMTKWKAIKALADQAGIWSPSTDSLKRSWAKVKSARRVRKHRQSSPPRNT